MVEAMAFIKTETHLNVPDIQLHYAPLTVDKKLARNFGFDYFEDIPYG